MGMCYRYAGSSSYPRFEQEIEKIVRLLGGVPSKELEDKKKGVKVKEDGIKVYFNDMKDFLSYGFGNFFSVDGNLFVFPKDTDEVVVKWLNDPYEKRTYDETVTIYNCICKFKEEIDEFAHQILYELERSINNQEGWYIYM